MNRVTLTGYIASDVELKSTEQGVSVLKFQLAVKRPHTKDTTDFFTVVCWRSTAEFVAKWFRKGSGIEVSGYITVRKWEDNNGSTRYATDVIADEIDFGKRSNADKTQDENTSEQEPPRKDEPQPNYEEIEEGDDLPF